MTVSGTDHEQSLISFSSFRGISQSTYDDFLSYLRGIPGNIHAALILREPNGSPNVGANLPWAHSRHADLADFTLWWLNR
jgi:hypothetical protein